MRIFVLAIAAWCWAGPAASPPAAAAGCGGCGAAPTAADIRHFAAQWLDSPRYRQTLLEPAVSHLGFAMRAGGDGRKTAVAVVGRRR